jgi:hypothetical protein
MKTFLSILFCLVGLSSFGQATSDENGRPIGSKPANIVSSAESDIYLRKDKAKSSSSDIIVDYSLPFGETSGKLVLFHPAKDEELKTIILNSNNGSVTVLTKEVGFEFFNAGLYLSDDTFVKSQSIY